MSIMKNDLKQTAAVLCYCVLFIPWLFLTIIYKPLDRFMRASAKYLDVE